MNKQIGILIFIGSLMFAAVPEANAQGYEQNRYESHSRYRAQLRRSKHMPQWLRRDKSFRHWYRHSSLKRNYYLAWPQLLEIYLWERRYSHHRPRRDYYSNRIRDYGWYRRYWQDYDHRQRRSRSERNRRRG